MLSRRFTTAMLTAFILSGIFTYLLSRRIEHQAGLQRTQAINYVATSRPVQPGEVIKVSDLRYVPWPASSPLRGGFLHIDEIIGRSAIYPIDPGQPLLDRQITPAGIGPGLASKIPDGMRAIALKSDEVVGVAGFLEPGSHLDVLVTFRAEKSLELTTTIVLQNAEVVAAGHQAEPDPDGKSSAATVVTLLLSPQESERAVLASAQGNIHFILRNNTDKGRTDSLSLVTSQLMGSSNLTLATGRNQANTLSANFIKRSGIHIGETSQQIFRIETVLGDQIPSDKSSERMAQ
ncbi:Flp pilus assembly protein CpaB [Granulicella arctica]|uniref:Flp pilus assembly protein CpaB n=1 Tax=Granulicella arctica TaxID=940613 RepID=UPI0021E0A203|nr:Flp pilus assembly protein CpaB [Granulicella arctica]